jgi:signal transduction histidine kinase
MKFFFDLSYRYKIPIWGSVLIIVPAFMVSALLITSAYDDLKHEVIAGSENLARTLSRSLFGAMLHDDVWRAFQLVRSPLPRAGQGDAITMENLIVLDTNRRVYVSTAPADFPMLAEFAALGDEFRAVATRLDEAKQDEPLIVELPSSDRIYIMTPIAEDEARMGTLVLVHTKESFRSRFHAIAQRALFTTALILAVLLPINWYWARRTVVPLTQLADRAGQVAYRVPEDLAPEIYNYQDELGRLYQAFGLMIKALRDKERLEKEMIQSERLAAVGRLSAGIAHEINNPLAGMLVALDNFKRRGGADERTLKTASMIERGLTQIKETVAAMMVEARSASRNVSAQDMGDVQTLVAADARKKSVRLVFEGSPVDPIALPATPVRQILINLLLNAIQASDPGGEVACAIALDAGSLRIEIVNGGKPLPPERVEHLFEPFAGRSESGHGLGLWVTYQIAAQLGGRIQVESAHGLTHFVVTLPTGALA